MYQPVVEIDLNALQHNLQRIQYYAPDAQILAMVKSDAYGHGLIEAARSLSGANALGVARAHEAKALIDAKIKHKVVLLEGCFSQEEFDWAVQHNIEFVIHSQQQLELFLAQKPKRAIKIWLKLDTGMHRLGFDSAQFIAAYKQLQASQFCSGIVCMTHFSCADEIDNEINAQQMTQFENVCAGLDSQQSIANSAVILTQSTEIKDWVRPGIALYGASPLEAQAAIDFNLIPVMTFKAKVTAIKTVAKGESVGYGQKWTADKPSKIAVIGVGYGDGYPRHAQNGTPIVIKDQEVHLVGRVSMDMITADITDTDNITVGDDVTLWGKGLPCEAVASKSDTISYTLFCGITKRVKRVYLGQ